MLPFFTYLNKLHPLSAEATAALMKMVRAKELRKGQAWLQEGAVCDKLTFVMKGLMKLYFETGSKEVVLHFARENDFILSAQSYLEQLPSEYTIRTTEPAVIVYFLRNDLQHLLAKFPELNLHFLLIDQQQSFAYEYHMGLLMLSPKERYEKLAQDHAWMVDGSRITDRMLAGYLGVGANAVCGWRKSG